MSIFDKFIKPKKTEKECPELFADFLKMYPPSDNLKKPEQSFLETAAKVVPAELIEFWKTYGFGSYGDGLVKIVNPTDYMGCLYTWLGGEDFSKIPIMVTAFGDIIYYRRLSQTEDDVCLLNVHQRKVEVLAYSFQAFWKKTIVDENVMSGILHMDLYNESLKLKGTLQDNEIYYFVPALVLGGEISVKNVGKGDAIAHLHMLFQLGN